MSAEEDVELRELVSQALESNGVLPKIRAELRANVFLALEETNNSKTQLQSEALTSLLKSPNGPIILNIIKEFLEFYELDFTLSVFKPETRFSSDYPELSRDKLIKHLNLNENNLNNENPILVHLVNSVGSNGKNLSLLSSAIANSHIQNNGASPGLNATYTKEKDEESNHSPVVSKSDEDIVFSKSSDSESSSYKTTPRKEKQPPAEDLLSPFNSAELQKQSTLSVKSEVESNLLMFSPDKREEGIKAKSMLGDLPPLNLKSDINKYKTKKMDEIKAIVDQGLDMENYDEDFMSSLSSKESKDTKDVEEKDEDTEKKDAMSVKSDKSQKTESVGEELEDDVSDLLNSHASSDSQITVDETISRASDVGDHMENV